AAGSIRQAAVPTGARATKLLVACPHEVPARTAARVDKSVTFERFERLSINVFARALSYGRFVGDKSEPIHIFDDCGFVFRPTALPIVVLDPQENATVQSPRLPPD